MLKKKLHTLLFEPSTVAGVEMIVSSEGQSLFHLTILNRKNSVISLQSFEQDIKSIENLKQHLPDNLPISLVINGRDVQNEKVKSENNHKQIIRKILTNANEDEFYLQRLSVGDNNIIASIIRKQTLESIVQQFEKQNIPLVNISIGPFCIGALYPIIKEKGQDTFDFSVGGHQLTFHNHSIHDYKETADTNNGTMMNVSGKEMPQKLLIAFAGGFQQLSGTPISLNAPLVKVHRTQWQQKRLFRPLGYSILGLFLLLSFTNVSLFGYLNTEVKSLSRKVGNKQDQLLYLESLKEQLEIKKKFLQKAGWLKPSRTSFHAYRIARTIPKTIYLELLSVHPQIKDIQNTSKKVYRHETDKINIKGISRDTDAFNTWIEVIKNEKWVKKVVVEYYRERSRSINTEFSIQLFI